MRRVRAVSSLHVLTTESAGMTEGYVQTWLEEEMALFNTVSAHGLEAEVRTEVDTYRAQRRGGRGLQGMGTKEEDWVEHLFVASAHEYLMIFTR